MNDGFHNWLKLLKATPRNWGFVNGRIRTEGKSLVNGGQCPLMATSKRNDAFSGGKFHGLTRYVTGTIVFAADKILHEKLRTQLLEACGLKEKS